MDMQYVALGPLPNLNYLIEHFNRNWYLMQENYDIINCTVYDGCLKCFIQKYFILFQDCDTK